MPQPDTQHGSALANNTIELTEGERTALAPEAPATPVEGAAAAAAPEAGTAAPAAPAADAGTAAAPAAGADAAAVAAAAVADPPVAPAVVAAPAPQAPSAPFVPTLSVPADNRDFTAELSKVDQDIKALREQRSAGELDHLDDDAFEQQLDTLKDLRTDIRVDQREAKTRADFNTQSADQAWIYLQTQFFADPANAPIQANGILFSAWEAAMQEVVNEAAKEGRPVTDWSVMVGARQKLVDQGIPLPGSAPAATSTTPAPTPPKPDRTPPLGNVPQTLAHAPSAADPGTRTTAEALADDPDIESIERTLAGKSDAERDAILRGTPGAFAD
jgi:hypothetical protein